jgi:tetratricopeptide (TPR) repeat protein
MPKAESRRPLRTASLIALFLISFAAPTVFAQKGDMPLTASKEALELFKQGREKAENLEDVGTLFDQAVQKDPNFAFGYLFAGRGNRDFQKNLAIALSLADKASPGEREWIFAVREQNSGNPVGRLAHLEKLLKLHPTDKRVHTQVGLYYRQNGDETTALQHFTESAKLDKSHAPAWNDIGYSNFALGKFDDAEKAFKTYIGLIPNNPNPYDSYAELLMKNGKYDESITQYNMALSRDPTFFGSYRGIGNNYAYKGDFAKSRETYQQMFSKATDPADRDLALASIMNTWLMEGKFDKAMEVNEQRIANARKDNDVQAVLNLNVVAGFINLESGEMEKAANYFKAARDLTDDPALPAGAAENRRFGARFQLARLSAARGDFDAARSEVDAMRQFVAARKNVNQERTYNLAAGYVELKQKNYTKANEFFAKANPNDPFVWFHRAAALEGSGDKKSAAELYRKVVAWNQLDTTPYSVVRYRAIAKLQE